MKKSRDSLLFYAAMFLLIGMTFRCFDSVELNPQATQLATKYFAKPLEQQATYWGAAPATKVISIPTWCGWSSLMLGAILLFESFMTPKEH